jgi:hypothetical protein
MVRERGMDSSGSGQQQTMGSCNTAKKLVFNKEISKRFSHQKFATISCPTTEGTCPMHLNLLGLSDTLDI